MNEAQFSQKRTMEDQDGVSSSVCYATVRTAKNVDAKAIIIPTISGKTARLMSNFRPDIPIYAVSPLYRMCRRMQIYWGVTPLKGKQERNQTLLIDHAIETVKEAGFVKPGDRVVITAGDPIFNVRGEAESCGETNMMYVVTVEE